MTRKLEIVKGDTRLYFDIATGFVRIDRNGGGLTIQLSYDDMLDLGAATMAARRAMRAKEG